MFFKVLKNVMKQDRSILIYLIGATLFYTLDAASMLFIIPVIEYVTTGNLGPIGPLEMGSGYFLFSSLEKYITFIIFMQFFLLLGSIIVSKYLALKSLNYGFKLGNYYLENLLKQSASEIKKQSLDSVIDICQRESERIGHSVVLPLMICITRLIFLLLIVLISIIYIDTFITFALGVFILVFILLFLFISPMLKSLSGQLNSFSADRLSSAEDILTCFNILKLRDFRHYFLDHANNAGKRYSNAYSKIELSINVPRYLIDFCFIAILCVIALQISATDKYENVTTELAILTIAILKFIPSANNVYQNYAKFRANAGALEKVEKTLDSLMNNLSGADLKYTEVSLWRENKVKANTEFNYLRVENLMPNTPDLHNLFQRSISFTFYLNSLYVITGSNGSGKTTFLNMLAGIEATSNASFILGNFNEEMKLSGYGLREACWKMDQDTPIFKSSLINNCSLFNYLQFDNNHDSPCQILASTIYQEFPETIKTSKDISHLALSGGQKQKIGMMRALLSNSPVLLLDEPTNSMDKETKKDFVALIKKLKSRKIIICISHDPELLQISDQTLLMTGASLDVSKS